MSCLTPAPCSAIGGKHIGLTFSIYVQPKFLFTVTCSNSILLRKYAVFEYAKQGVELALEGHLFESVALYLRYQFYVYYSQCAESVNFRECCLACVLILDWDCRLWPLSSRVSVLFSSLNTWITERSPCWDVGCEDPYLFCLRLYRHVYYNVPCKTLGFHGGHCEECRLLGYGAVWLL
jgi:hypothetical protein